MNLPCYRFCRTRFFITKISEVPDHEYALDFVSNSDSKYPLGSLKNAVFAMINFFANAVFAVFAMMGLSYRTPEAVKHGFCYPASRSYSFSLRLKSETLPASETL